jgi:hypothetical protein
MVSSTATTGHAPLPTALGRLPQLHQADGRAGGRPRSRRPGRCSRPRMTRRNRARPRGIGDAGRGGGAARPGAIGWPRAVQLHPLAEPVAAKRVLAHLRRQGRPQRVAVQEVVERRVDDPPGGLVDLAAVRDGELPEVEAGIGPAGPWSTSRRITPSSLTFGRVEMASNSECSRLPALAAMASKVSSVTTCNYYKPAARAGLPATLRFYDLRHPAASLLIPEGASVKAVQKQLGHATASITLDTYGHLFPRRAGRAPRPLGGPSRPGARGTADRRGVAPRSSRSANVQVSSPEGSCRRRVRTRRRAAPPSEVVAVNAARPAILARPS